jgi:predicted site-specific integrase-resolvase
MATTSTHLLTEYEAAAYLAVLPARLKRWAKAGLIPSVELPDGQLRFAAAELDAWVTNHCRNVQATESK